MNPLERVVQALSSIPGIGEKTATRHALFLLRDEKGLARAIADALVAMKEKVRFCNVCQNLTEEEVCFICKDPTRHREQICVIQEPVDLLIVEKTGEFRGLYHVLHGALSPLDGVGPEQIKIEGLVKRVKAGGVTEVILATNSNPEGETTALYLKKVLTPLKVRLSRIASGVPVGGTIEFTDAQTLARALGHRRDF